MPLDPQALTDTYSTIGQLQGQLAGLNLAQQAQLQSIRQQDQMLRLLLPLIQRAQYQRTLAALRADNAYLSALKLQNTELSNRISNLNTLYGNYTSARSQVRQLIRDFSMAADPKQQAAIAAELNDQAMLMMTLAGQFNAARAAFSQNFPDMESYVPPMINMRSVEALTSALPSADGEAKAAGAGSRTLTDWLLPIAGLGLAGRELYIRKKRKAASKLGEAEKVVKQTLPAVEDLAQRAEQTVKDNVGRVLRRGSGVLKGKTFSSAPSAPAPTSKTALPSKVAWKMEPTGEWRAIHPVQTSGNWIASRMLPEGKWVRTTLRGLGKKAGGVEGGLLDVVDFLTHGGVSRAVQQAMERFLNPIGNKWY